MITQTDITGKPYPMPSDSDESSEKPQPSESVLEPPKSNKGAASSPDDDSQWDLPCGVGATPSPTM